MTVSVAAYGAAEYAGAAEYDGAAEYAVGADSTGSSNNMMSHFNYFIDP